MKAYVGVCLIILTLMVRVSAQDSSLVVTSKDLIDTSAPGWVWNAMDTYEDSQLSRGAGKAGGPGGYGASPPRTIEGSHTTARFTGVTGLWVLT